MNKIIIVPGSLADSAAKDNVSLAETFLSADAVILCDVSGSMEARDSRDGKSRFDVLKEELAHLQATKPGKLAVIAFSSWPVFEPGGEPVFLGGGTDLAGALRFAKVADVSDVQFYVISDGRPDDEADALAVARGYQGKIHCIYVGPEDGSGQKFLERLSQAAGGRFATAAQVVSLAATTERLMLGG